MVKAAIDAFGQVDAVVNNAGYTWDGVIHKMTDEQFQAMLDIHTIVPFRVIRALAPSWREAAKKEAQEGEEVFRKIVNVTSISGTMGNAGQANYSSAKAGVTGLTKTIAKEWGQFKINCNAVAFGFVETRLTQAKEKGETMQAAGESGEEVSLGDPRAAAPDGATDDPARPAGGALGRRGPGPVPVLAALQLHPRAGDQRDRRSVHRHVLLDGPTPSAAPPERLPALAAAPPGGQLPNQLSRAPSTVITQPEKKSPAGEARYAISQAISSSVPSRPSGTVPATLSTIAFGYLVRSVSVSNCPIATATAGPRSAPTPPTTSASCSPPRPAPRRCGPSRGSPCAGRR